MNEKNTPYIGAVVIMFLIGVVATTSIVIARPESDNSILIATILGLVASTTASILAFLKSQETHLSVNSRLDGFIANAEKASHAEGVIEGRDDAKNSLTK